MNVVHYLFGGVCGGAVAGIAVATCLGVSDVRGLAATLGALQVAWTAMTVLLKD